MTTIDLIRWTMTMSDAMVSGAAEQLRDAAMVQPTPLGGNHPLWTMGHLALAEGDLAHILFGEPNPVDRWRPLFGQGSQPSTDPSAYPPYDEVLATYRDLRARNIARLDSLAEADLDAPPAAVPPGFEAMMTSIGTTIVLLSLHAVSHLGQLADARRAAGKPPRF